GPGRGPQPPPPIGRFSGQTAGPGGEPCRASRAATPARSSGPALWQASWQASCSSRPLPQKLIQLFPGRDGGRATVAADDDGAGRATVFNAPLQGPPPQQPRAV